MFTLQHVTFRDILTIDDLVLGDVPVTAIVGNSGSGKTTLLRLLNRMKSPTSGTITFQKKNLVDWNPVLLRRHVAMLSQTPVLFGESVRENLEAGCRLSERALPDAASMEEALWRVHLHQPLDGEVRHLSGGEKQRLAIARVLLLHADVLLLDEPSSALDVETARAVVQDTLRMAQEDAMPVIMVTHDLEMAHAFSDCLVMVHEQGQIDALEERREVNVKRRENVKKGGEMVRGPRSANAERKEHAEGERE